VSQDFAGGHQRLEPSVDGSSRTLRVDNRRPHTLLLQHSIVETSGVTQATAAHAARGHVRSACAGTHCLHTDIHNEVALGRCR